MKTQVSQRSFIEDCAVSSVVEHYLDTVGVRGSKPLPRTILFQAKFAIAIFFLIAMTWRAFAGGADANVVQMDVESVLNTRAVATFTQDKIVPLKMDVDGAGGLVTQAVAEKLGNPNPHPLPDDGVFPATEQHPRVVLHFSNADGEHNQVRRSEGEDEFSFNASDKKYSRMLLFFSSGHFGPAKIQIRLIYRDATAETRDMEVPDWYFPLKPGDSDRCYLATNLGKWNNQNKMIEKDHHFIYGIDVHPDPGKVLSRIQVHKFGTCVLAFWGATGVTVD
jgi:hypothetical protein